MQPVCRVELQNGPPSEYLQILLLCLLRAEPHDSAGTRGTPSEPPLPPLIDEALGGGDQDELAGDVTSLSLAVGLGNVLERERAGTDAQLFPARRAQ